MRSKSKILHHSLSVVVMVGLTAILASSCSHPQKKGEGEGAGANGAMGAGMVSDKEIVSDSQGSDSGKIPGLATVHFEYDKDRLTSESRGILKQDADWIKNHPNFTVQIEGHTDSRGSIEYNLALGERRAKSVRSYLETVGIPAKRLTIISYGKEKPIAQGEDEAAWAQNRRANFVPLQ